MGFASYLEDLLEQLNSVSRKYSGEHISPTELEQLIQQAKKLLKDIQSWVDLATDPSTNIARQLINLEARYKELAFKCQQLETENKMLKNENDSLVKFKNLYLKIVQQYKVVKANTEHLKYERNELFRENNLLKKENEELRERLIQEKGITLPSERIIWISKKSVGLRQTLKAIEREQAKMVFVAADANSEIMNLIIRAAANKRIITQVIPSMKELGQACGFNFECVAAVIIKK